MFFWVMFEVFCGTFPWLSFFLVVFLGGSSGDLLAMLGFTIGLVVLCFF